jgi:hypothetical protein
MIGKKWKMNKTPKPRKEKQRPSIVVHAYNPGYSGGEGKKISAKASLGKSATVYLKNN